MQNFHGCSACQGRNFINYSILIIIYYFLSMVYDLSCIVYYMFNSTAENSVSHSKEVFMALH